MVTYLACLLICPNCEAALKESEKENLLFCPACKRKYALNSGILALLPEE